MKRSLFVALVLASSSLMALDTQWFVGADASSAKVKAKLNYNGGSSDLSDRDTALGLKAGVILDKNHRVSVNYAKYDLAKESVTAELTNATFNYDYLFDPLNSVTLFAGAHVGMNKFDAVGYDDTALTYGAQAGVLYPLVGNFELEAGMSYSKLAAKPSTSTLNGTYNGITFTNASASLEAKDMTALYLGINYKF